MSTNIPLAKAWLTAKVNISRAGSYTPSSMGVDEDLLNNYHSDYCRLSQAIALTLGLCLLICKMGNYTDSVWSHGGHVHEDLTPCVLRNRRSGQHSCAYHQQ